jgi:hypothetical protein
VYYTEKLIGKVSKGYINQTATEWKVDGVIYLHLLNVAVSDQDATAMSDMISEEWMRKDVERRGLGIPVILGNNNDMQNSQLLAWHRTSSPHMRQTWYPLICNIK